MFIRSLFSSSSAPDTRGISLENPSVSLTDPRAWSGGSGPSSTGINVSPALALSVPAVWACVNFISDEFASLPWEVFKKDKDNIIKAETDPLWPVLHDNPNSRTTSYQFRKSMMANCLTFGRAFAYIERNRMGRVMNLWLLEPSKVKVLLNADMSLSYVWTSPLNGAITYEQNQVLDIVWMPGPDGVSHVAPIDRLKNAIALSLGAEEYASRTFANGGLAPLKLGGSFKSAANAEKAASDIQSAMRTASDQKRQVIVYDKDNMTLEALGVDPSKNQLLELRTFQVVEIARAYGIPPTAIQDLSRATYSNLEMADLAIAKHCISHWCQRWEQECNLKLFTKGSGPVRYSRFDMDGAMRGDSVSRAKAGNLWIVSGVKTPNEVRVEEGLPLHEWGDNLITQSGNMPIAGLPGALDESGNVFEDANPVTDPDDDQVVSDDDASPAADESGSPEKAPTPPAQDAEPVAPAAPKSKKKVPAAKT